MSTSSNEDTTVLVVDDERSIRHLVRTAMLAEGLSVVEAGSFAACRQQLHEALPSMILLDLVLPDASGLEVLSYIRETHPELPVVLITAAGTSDSAINATRLGARDYLTKPLNLAQLREVVSRHLQPTGSTASANGSSLVDEIHPRQHNDDFVGRSPAMQNVFKTIGRVANQRVTVLIRGESGTGKELVARAIWQHSDRADKTFLAVNCAALSQSLLESELFGHEQGAFTGATQRRIGKFEQCSGGTLFLDEVGDMHPLGQGKLLRVLQDQRLTRIGGNTEIDVDVRLISATNANLERRCREGEFREDLYHRLNGFSIDVPPLRERKGDIRLLVEHFLYRFNQKLSKVVERVDADAAQLLLDYSWPGNVRELQAVLGQAILNSVGSTITPRELPAYITTPPPRRPQDAQPPSTETIAPVPSNGDWDLASFVDNKLTHGSNEIYAESIAFAERCVLGKVLEVEGGNQSAAARRLGITRGSLRFKLRNLGITIDSEVRVPKRR